MNQPIDDAVFDFRAHSSTDGKRILDCRLGDDAAVITGRVGSEDFPASTLGAARGTSERLRLFVIIGSNVVMALAIAILLLRRRKSAT